LSGGVCRFEQEQRVHVAIGPNGTAEEGKLFGTEGLRLWGIWFKPNNLSHEVSGERNAVELAYAVDVEIRDPGLKTLPLGMRPLGGKHGWCDGMR
jgi:hypothetical protein